MLVPTGIAQAHCVARLKSWIDKLEIDAKNRVGYVVKEGEIEIGFDPEYNYNWHLHREVRRWWPEGITDG